MTAERQPCPVCDGLPEDWVQHDYRKAAQRYRVQRIAGTLAHLTERVYRDNLANIGMFWHGPGPYERHQDAKPCCNPSCRGDRGTGCYHCHSAELWTAERVPGLAIIEAWARARGWWLAEATTVSAGRSWTLWGHDDGDVTIQAMLSEGFARWRVSSSVALLWAVLLEGAPLTVDVGRCPRCHDDEFCRGYCVTCISSGRDIREAARLWLDWQAKRTEAYGRGFTLDELLTMAADMAQPDLEGLRPPDSFEPRGEWLALALAGSDEWEAAARLALARAAHRRMHGEADGDGDGGAACKCGDPGEASHPCPYQAETFGEPGFRCNCCPGCREQCLQDI